MVEPPAPQSKPLIERAGTWLTVLGAVVSLVFGVTQQRPASAVALAVGLVVVLVGVVVFVTTARAADGSRRYPVKARRAALVTSSVLVTATAVAFAVPASRGVIVHNVLGFPSVSQEVRIADVNVSQNNEAYRVEIIILNQLRTEEMVHDVELHVAEPCPADAQPDHYKIDAEFTVGAADENGSTLDGSAFRLGEDGDFSSVVTGTMTVCSGGNANVSLKLGVGAVLPPGQHATITLDVPKAIQVMEVVDTRSRPTRPGPVDSPLPTTPATTPEPRKSDVAVQIPTGGPADDPNATLVVTLFIGEPSAEITYTSS